jgi:hypothetical protein
MEEEEGFIWPACARAEAAVTPSRDGPECECVEFYGCDGLWTVPAASTILVSADTVRITWI